LALLAAIVLTLVAFRQAPAETAAMPRIVLGQSPEPPESRRLDGATIPGLGYVFLAGVDDARSVRFYLDGDPQSSRPFHIAGQAPFYLLGRNRAANPIPLHSSSLDEGRHVLTAVVERPGRTSLTLRATFKIRHLHLSPRGFDGSRCGAARPCRSLARAFALAQPGQAIVLADGYYGCEPVVTGSKSADVVFRPAPEAQATVRCSLTLEDARHIAFEDIDIAGLRMKEGVEGVTLRRVDITCRDEPPFELWEGKCSAGLFGAPTRFRMLGGSIGPTWEGGAASGNSQLGVGGGKDILLDGVWVHDNRRPGKEHTECLMVAGGDGVTIRNSRFERCDIFAIFFTHGDWIDEEYPPLRNVVVENNLILPGKMPYYSVLFNDDISEIDGLVFRYNTMVSAVSFATDLNDASVVANIAPDGDCHGDARYEFNVWQGEEPDPCSRSDTVVRGREDAINSVVDREGRLLPDSPAIDRGDPSAYPPRDIEGVRRPIGDRPDAGAYEAR
jgi:hypothetical protein